MRYLISNTILFIFLSMQLSAQTLSAYKTAYEEAVFNKDYYNAFKYASESLEFDESNIDLLYRYAEAARFMDAYTIAAESYAKVVDNDGNGKYEDASYYLAAMLQRLGKYEEARMNYELFLSETNDLNAKEALKSSKEIKAIEWAEELIAKSDTTAKVDKIEDDINTAYSEFGAIRYKDKLIFSSLRFKDESTEFNSGGLRSKIIVEDSTEMESLNHKTLHTAHSSFSKNGDRMYYTICEYDNSYDIRCDIYYRSITQNGEYGEGIKLPDHINANMATNTQPNIAFDELTGEEYLFFVSNREEGKGGFDIWYSEVLEGAFSSPINLEEINTAENEVTPFYHSKSRKLYFSSDGYLGFGGYDVFEVESFKNIKATPRNVGLPVNSSYNDIYYVLDDEGSSALFSSNRDGSLYLENSFEACCYDVYEASLEPCDIDLSALTYTKEGEELIDATVQLYNIKTGELLDEILSEDINDHRFEIECNKEYKLIGIKAGYISDTLSFSSYNRAGDSLIIKKLYLGIDSSLIRMDLSVFDEESLEALAGASVQVECLDNNEIINRQTNMVGNDFFILLNRDCNKYKIDITREGYEPKSIYVENIGADDNFYISEKVYLRKIGSRNNDLTELNNYLPLTVFYDNDDPDRKNFSLYTDSNYSDSYYSYIVKKEEFMMEYSKGQTGDMKYLAQNDVARFFEDELRMGYEKMQVFISKLLETLQNGNTVEITIRGYTSPRASYKYNLALGQRRINNVINELRDYGGGVVKPYLDNGQLVVRQISYGESLSDGKVNDQINNERESVYSPDASRERKSEIISINNINE